MISSKEMFSRFNEVSFDYESLINNNEYRQQYSTEAIGLEIGYYSKSKTDLYINGIKRGRLISKIPKIFDGFIYYFDDNKMVMARRMVNNREADITFIDYSEQYCFGYTYAVVGGLIPRRCFVYEMDADRIIGFKYSNSYHNDGEIKPPAIIIDEKYNYSNEGLCSIEVTNSFYDFASGNEHVNNHMICDYYNGKYWFPTFK